MAKNDGISIQRQADGSFKSTISGIRIFEMIQNVTGYIEGELSDWPAQLQDPIYEAVERKAKEVELPLTIVYSRCHIDYGDAQDGTDDKFYIHVIASEIVVADEREINKMAIEKAVRDITKGRTIQ